MRTGRKTRLRRILRRKRVKRAIKAYGNYIAAGVLIFVVCVAVVGAAVKPTASTLPKNTPEPVQTTQPTGSTTEEAEAYPFNLMSFDWDGEALDGWTRYEVPERTDEEKRMLKKAAWYSNLMDKRKPPTALIGEPEEED